MSDLGHNDGVNGKWRNDICISAATTAESNELIAVAAAMRHGHHGSGRRSALLVADGD